MNTNIKKLTHVILTGALLCLIMFLFWRPLCKVIDATLLPLFSPIGNNRPSVVIAITLLVTITYFLNWKTLKREQMFTTRRVAVALLLAVLLFFRIYNSMDPNGYVYSGIFDGKINYYVILLAEVLLAECICLIPQIRLYIKRKEKIDSTAITTTPFMPDIPTEDDKYDRSRYAELLVDKIITTTGELKNKPHNGSFNILLSEYYGYGKTSFLLMVENASKKRGIEYLSYRPWLCEDSEKMVGDFFLLLAEKFIGDKHIQKLFHLYSNLVATGVSNKVAKTVLFFSEANSIETLHDKISSELRDREKPIVIAIDDVDRLQYKELMSLFKLIRNTADFPNLYYIIAADKKAIIQMMQSEGKIQNPERYLHKFFNYEMMFPASEVGSIDIIFTESLEQVLKLYGLHIFHRIKFGDNIRLNDIFHNPRDIYRYMNLLSSELDNLKTTLCKDNTNKSGIRMDDICIEDLIKVLIIRFLMPDIYKLFRDNKDTYFLNYEKGGRLVLSDKYDSFFSSHFSKKTDNKNIIDSNKKPSSDVDRLKTNPTNEPSSFNDIIKENEPTNQDIILSIFRKLWSPERPIDNHPHSVNNSKYFFRYFTCTKMFNQLTIQEVYYRMVSLTRDNFCSWIKVEINKNNMRDIKIIIDTLVDRGVPMQDRFNFFVNTITCIHKQFKNEVKKGTYYKGLTILSVYYEWRSIITKLLTQDDVKPVEELQQPFQTFFTHRNDFEICLRVLFDIRFNEYKKSSIFAIEWIYDWGKQLIDRFFKVVVKADPYDNNTLDIHFSCILVNKEYWISKFHSYLASLDEPARLNWLYGTIYWDSNKEQYFWNNNIIERIYSIIYFPESITRIFKDLLPEEYKEPLSKLLSSYDTNNGAVGFNDMGFYDNNNQLLANVKKWQEEGKNPFPIPDNKAE